jgi:hypothetical protein
VTPPNLTYRGKSNTKRHVISDRHVTSLPIRITGANLYDSTMLETVVDAIRPIRRPCGRPHTRSVKLHADTGLRLSGLPAGADPVPHHSAHRTQGDRVDDDAKAAPLGGGTDHGVAQ